MTKNSKLYTFEDKEDLIVYTNLIVELIVKHLDRHKRYVVELGKFLEGKEFVKYEEYKAIEDKMNTPQNYLLNLFGDQSKNAASYFRIRSVMKKKAEAFGFEYKELDQETREIMNQLYLKRNYEHHFTDAKIMEWGLYRKEQVKSYPNFKWPSEIISVNYHEFLRIEDARKNYVRAKSLQNSFEKLLQLIKKDYSILIGKSMRIQRDFDESPMPVHNSIISAKGELRHMGKIK